MQDDPERARVLEAEVRRLRALLDQQARTSRVGTATQAYLAAPGVEEWQLRTDRTGRLVRFADARLLALLGLGPLPEGDVPLERLDALPGAPGLLAQLVAEAAARSGHTVRREHELPASEGRPARALALRATHTPTGTVLVVSDDTRRRRLSQWFGRYASPAVLAALEQSPESFFRLHEVEATLLFCDLVNYSGNVAAMAPAQVGRLLNTFFRIGIDIVESHQGMVVQFVGDELMVVFGAPLPSATHALEASRCALSLLAVHESVRASWRAQGLPELGVRIGLATGPALAGNLGDERRAAWCVVGHATNLAARMLAAAEPGQALATRAVVEAVGRTPAPGEGGARPRFVPLPRPVEAKNMGPVEAWRVER